MTETESIVLEHLRHIRGAVDGLRDDMREVKQRVGALETELAQVIVRLAEMSNRMDRLSDRVERIERRLELAPV
jgi:predicted  nucleic acid-binding Zn-ribbon protein